MSAWRVLVIVKHLFILLGWPSSERTTFGGFAWPAASLAELGVSCWFLGDLLVTSPFLMGSVFSELAQAMASLCNASDVNRQSLGPRTFPKMCVKKKRNCQMLKLFIAVIHRSSLRLSW